MVGTPRKGVKNVKFRCHDRVIIVGLTAVLGERGEEEEGEFINGEKETPGERTFHSLIGPRMMTKASNIVLTLRT